MALPPTTAAASAGADGGASYGPPSLLGNLGNPDINESSGLAAGRRNPGHYWTHNDSGDGPFVYCVGEAGEPCGVWQLTGAEARDWEDMAAGPGPVAGRSYLYLGDIGDNSAELPDVTVYRAAEPDVTPVTAVSSQASPQRTEPADVLRLRYPDGPHDAEALLVHPQTGDLYIVTKARAEAGVYVARAPLTGGSPVTMTKLGSVDLPFGLDPLSALVTGGDISPDGRRVALATYGSGYELETPSTAGGFDAVWHETPRRIVLGARRQGEAIAYRLDGRALLTTSEGVPAPLHQVERR